MRFGRLLVALALLASISSRALASTIIVDVNGTGQFTDIPPAIAAAQDGDIIVVLPGTYSPFGLTKSLTIVGRGNVTLGNFGSISIGSIPAGHRAAVVNLHSYSLSIANCAGPVIAQDIVPPGGIWLNSLVITQSNDVRLRGIGVWGTTQPAQSRIELVRARIRAADGGIGQNPQVGLDSAGGNRMHLVLSEATGGYGRDSTTSWAGNGSAAIRLLASDTLIYAGTGIGQLLGGDGGQSIPHPSGTLPCYYWGQGAPAVIGLGGSNFRHSGGTIQGGNSFDWVTCQPTPQPGIYSSGTVVTATPDDPTLETVGVPTPGSPVQFVVRAPVGSLARLNFGRAPILVADGLAVVEKLAPSARVVNLGVVPASGQVTLNWNVPALPSGTMLVSQAEVVLQGGELRRTNSAPVVIR